MKKEGRASKLDVYEGVRDEVTQRENEAPGRRKKRQRRVVCRVLLPGQWIGLGAGPRASTGRPVDAGAGWCVVETYVFTRALRVLAFAHVRWA